MAFMCPLEEFNENADFLEFPEQFADAEALSLSEVHLLLQDRIKGDAMKDVETGYTEVFRKFFNYTDLFRKYRKKEDVNFIKESWKQSNLDKFESAMLLNVCPSSAHMAKKLIPSLEQRFTDNEITSLLHSLHEKETFCFKSLLSAADLSRV